MLGSVQWTENSDFVPSLFKGVFLRLDGGLNSTQGRQIVVSKHRDVHDQHYTVKAVGRVVVLLG